MDSSSTKGASAFAEMLVIVAAPIIFVIGVLGNITTIIILLRNKKYSTTIYLIFLAFADLTVTIFVFPRWFFIYIFRFDVRHISSFTCQLHVFLTYVAGRTSNTFLVAMTIERMISTVKPHQFSRYCNKRMATAICVSIVTIIFLSHAHIFYGFSLRRLTKVRNDTSANALGSGIFLCNESSNAFQNSADNVNENTTDREIIDNASTRQPFHLRSDEMVNSTENSIHVTSGTILCLSNVTERKESAILQSETLVLTVCTWEWDSVYSHFYTQIYEKVGIVFFFYLANTVFFMGFFVILAKLREARNRCKQPQDKKAFSRKQSVRITRTLLIVNLCFLVLTTPFLTFVMGRHIWIDKVKGMTDSQKILWSVFNIMYSFNYAINFLLYFCTGAKFRHQVRECCASCRRKRRVAPKETSFPGTTGGTTKFESK